MDFCSSNINRPIHIFTDSSYVILSLTKLKRFSSEYTIESQSLPHHINNLDLIQSTLDAIERYQFPVFISKVAAHTGRTDQHSIGNDYADALSKKGLIY